MQVLGFLENFNESVIVYMLFKLWIIDHLKMDLTYLNLGENKLTASFSHI